MKNLTFSWALLLASVSLFIYDLINRNNFTDIHNLWSLQMIEGVLLIAFALFSAKDYFRVIKNLLIHIVSFFAVFTVITTTKYELDHQILTVVHATSYLFLFIILSVVTRKK